MEAHWLGPRKCFPSNHTTEADARLWTSGVPELREALKIPDNSCMRILRNIYGSTTAPRGLWLSLDARFKELGAVAIRGERCLWAWYSKFALGGLQWLAI